jgi:phosphate starvation-inducible PhoH-like protein
MSQHPNYESKKRKTSKKSCKKRLIREAYEDYKCYEILEGTLNYIEDEEDNYVKINEIIPRNANQIIYSDYIRNQNIDIIFATGPAGTGKSFVGIAESLREIFELNNYKKLLITRPVVTCSEDLGYLPGSYEDKLDPYLRPIYDIFEKYLKKEDIKYYINEKIIEITPLGFIRGRTFGDDLKNNGVILIADEMQNSTPEQMKTLLTRIGENSKIIITGDPRQSDLNKPNGLSDFIQKYKSHSNKEELNSIKIIEFEKKDITRSKVIKTVLNIYGDKDN